jgi:hypothetical protein
VNVSPTMPRTPVIPIFSGFIIERHCTLRRVQNDHKNGHAPRLTSNIFGVPLKTRKPANTLSNFADSCTQHLLEYPLSIDENTGEVSFEPCLKKETIIR